MHQLNGVTGPQHSAVGLERSAQSPTGPYSPPPPKICDAGSHLRSIIKQDEYLVVYCGGKSHAHSRNFVAKDDDHKLFVCFLVTNLSSAICLHFLKFSNHYSHYFLRPGSYFASIGSFILEYDRFLQHG